MPPISTSCDVRDGSTANAKLTCKLFLGPTSSCVKPPNFPNLRLSKCRHVMAFALCFAHVSFLGCVTRIIAEGAKKKMTWIAALWVIAFVANTHPFGAYAKTEFKSDAMCSPELVLYRQHSITFCGKAPHPIPAFVRLSDVHLCPKTTCAKNRIIRVCFVDSACDCGTLGNSHAELLDQDQMIGTYKIT